MLHAAGGLEVWDEEPCLHFCSQYAQKFIRPNSLHGRFRDFGIEQVVGNKKTKQQRFLTPEIAGSGRISTPSSFPGRS